MGVPDRALEYALWGPPSSNLVGKLKTLYRSGGSERKLFDLLKKISNLRFLDPACGCGNFLVIAYRELRLLELDILLAMQELKKTGALDFEILKWVQVNVDPFYGIEIEEFPRQIAQVALWLSEVRLAVYSIAVTR